MLFLYDVDDADYKAVKGEATTNAKQCFIHICHIADRRAESCEVQIAPSGMATIRGAVDKSRYTTAIEPMNNFWIRESVEKA